MTGRIAVVGSNMIDLVTYVRRMPERGETLEAPRFEIGHGGKGANQAIAAARLGAEVVMVTKVGDDVFGQNTIANFEANGIDVSHVGIVAGLSSGVAPIFVEPSGENSILIIKGANAALHPADVDAAAGLLEACDLILMQMEIPLDTIYHTIAWARRHRIPTLLNPAPASGDLDAERIKDVTFLVPNETELAILSGLPIGSRSEIEAAARTLIAKGITSVIVTMGERGALLVEKGDIRLIEPVKVEPVDTTGAGDAFIGSFAPFNAGGLATEEALKKASAYAAHSITRRGTQKAYGSPTDLEDFMRSTGRS